MLSNTPLKMASTSHFHVESLRVLTTQFLLLDDSFYDLEIINNAFIFSTYTKQ